MELGEATRLIRDGVAVIKKDKKTQRWADLGSGEGLFTEALASILPSGSEVYAVDNDSRALNKIPDRINGTVLHKVTADFIASNLHVTELNGIVMANSLHFVKDKAALLSKLKEKTIDGRIIIVEYERDTSNPWIPYPLNFQELEILAKSVGFTQVTKLATAESQYHPGGIYAAVLG